MSKMAVLPTQAEVVDIRQRLPDSLESAAAQINRYLALADRANANAEVYRIKAGYELVRVRKRISHGEWEAWCRANIQRSMGDIRKVIQIAEDRDPKAALEREREKRRSDMVEVRANRAHVGALSDIGDRIFPLFQKCPENKKAELLSLMFIMLSEYQRSEFKLLIDERRW